MLQLNCRSLLTAATALAATGGGAEVRGYLKTKPDFGRYERVEFQV